MEENLRRVRSAPSERAYPARGREPQRWEEGKDACYLRYADGVKRGRLSGAGSRKKNALENNSRLLIHAAVSQPAARVFGNATNRVPRGVPPLWRPARVPYPCTYRKSKVVVPGWRSAILSTAAPSLGREPGPVGRGGAAAPPHLRG